MADARSGDRLLTGAVVGDDDEAAFAWLAAHAEPGERVLNQPADATGWMYGATDGGAVPMYGARSTPWYAINPDWAGRWYLLQHVADWSTDARVRDEARRWDVRYVVVGQRLIPGFTSELHLDALEHAPGIREVFRSGDAAVFELGA